MTAPPRVDRRAMRRSDPAALATILVGQLMAYRCSTVYAPTATKLDAFVVEEVLPRLREQLDVRTVIVDRWEKKQGPTVQQLIDHIHRQLEIEPPAAEMKPLAALEAALQRAERRSDRPILIVLYRLEQLLDDKRDPAEVSRFVEALSRMASMPLNGLHLVLGVKEEDLGAFRDLLRGRWRLLANDIRIRPGGKKWLLSIPLAVLAFVSTKTAEVAVVATACAGTGALVGAVASAQICAESEALSECKQENGRLKSPARSRTPEARTTASSPTAEALTEPAATAVNGTDAAAPSTTDATVDATVDAADPTDADVNTGTDTGADTGSDTGADEDVPLGPAPLAAAAPLPPPTKYCIPRPKNNACGKCVRSQCAVELKACKTLQWRACVVKGLIGQDDECTPEAVEHDCRDLALCALEYKCRADCFNN